MRCPHCNNENPEGYKFCAICGTPLEGVEAAQPQMQQPQQPVQPQQMPQQMGMQPQMQQMQQMGMQPQMQQPVKPKAPRKPLPIKLFIGLGAGLIAIIALVLFLVLRPTHINLNDYIKVRFDGCDGYGTATLSFENERFRKDYGDKIKYTSEYEDSYYKKYKGRLTDPYGWFYADYIKDSYKIDKTANLKNGDEVKVSWIINKEALEKKYKVKVDCDDIKFTAKGLKEVGTFDGFEGLDIKFEGTAPNGYTVIENTYPDEKFNNIRYKAEPSMGLSVGDEVTITIENYYTGGFTGLCNDLADEYGVIPEKETMTVTVDALDKYASSLSDIPESTLNDMNNKITEYYKTDAIHASDDGEMQLGCECIGNYLVYSKEDGYNTLYTVCKIHLWNDHDGEQYFYVYGYYSDIVIKADGSCDVDLDYCTVGMSTSFGYDEDSSYYYYGYKTLDELHDICVSDYDDEFYGVDENVTDTESTKGGADLNLIPSDAAEFNGHKYYFFSSDATWDEAKTACENRGGHLATITSEEEQTFINSICDSNAWLGGKREENISDTWIWITGETWSYECWTEGEPNNYDGEESYLGTYPQTWNDFCIDSYSIDGYICEWE